MKKEYRKLILYLCILFVAVLFSYKLPHNSYKISHYILPPIRLGTIVIYLNSILSLILAIIGFICILKFQLWNGKSRLAIFLLLAFIIIPLMKWSIDFTRTGYHWIRKDGLRAVDIEDPSLNISTSNNLTTLHVDLKLLDYSRRSNSFRIRVYPPDPIVKLTGKKAIELEPVFHTIGNRREFHVQEEVSVYTVDTNYMHELAESQWYYDDTRYELFNNKETVMIIDHGID